MRTSTNGRFEAKLKMTLAALQCSLSSESRSSCRFASPQPDISYVTAGIMTLKYRLINEFIHLVRCLWLSYVEDDENQSQSEVCRMLRHLDVDVIRSREEKAA